ncbi:hypothetical protein [Hydrogenimonas sp.]
MALRIFFFAIGTLTLLFAESGAQTDLSFSVGSDLFTSLEEASAIATTSRLNIDEMPEFVTVLRRQELRALGVENLFDAEVRDSSYYSRHEKGIVRPGRTFFITIEYPL